jgi:prolyl oligopeptidase
MTKYGALVALGALFLGACIPQAKGPSDQGPRGRGSRRSPLAFPETRAEAVAETFFGVRVNDPYRWLEDKDAPEVAAWTDAQNAFTRSVVDGWPGRETLKGTIQALLDAGSIGVPDVKKRADGSMRVFYTKRSSTQRQPVLYVRDGFDGHDTAVVDVNNLSADGTTSLDWWVASPKGNVVAYGLSESGSEESVLHLARIDAKGRVSEGGERIPYTRHAAVAWLPDETGFYYTRYPVPGTVPAGDEKYFRKVYEHRLGNDAAADAVVFGDGRGKTDSPSVEVTADGRYIVVTVHMGWQRSEVYLSDRKAKPRGFVAVAAGKETIFEPIVADDALYLRTNDGAPNGKLLAIDYAKPLLEKARVVVPEGKSALTHVSRLGSRFVLHRFENAASRVSVVERDGSGERDVTLPSFGTATVGESADADTGILHFSSFGSAPAVYRFDAKTGVAARWQGVDLTRELPEIVTERRVVTSKDGTPVPLFVVHRKDLGPGPHTTVLYGYGGFNVPVAPGFSARALAVALSGGVWAQAILRGGSEFGEAWHQAGMRGRKQNVFDDYLACARALASDGTSDAGHLVAMGGSNGGLLVATAVSQAPELFRVGLSLVPLTDMLRYPLYRIAKLWIPEYGDPSSEDDFQWLYAYSPYHQAKAAQYPSMLFTTAESDSRVDPMHARKMGARLQALQSDKARPVLVRVEKNAGHGAGKPTTKLAEEMVDELGFAFDETGLDPLPWLPDVAPAPSDGTGAVETSVQSSARAVQ